MNKLTYVDCRMPDCRPCCVCSSFIGVWHVQFQAPGCRDKSRLCKYGFPCKVQPNRKPVVDDESGRFLYYRPRYCDRNVVPYHPTIALLWNAHSNIQLVTDKEWSFYLLKYAMKVGPGTTMFECIWLPDMVRRHDCTYMGRAAVTECCNWYCRLNLAVT